MNTIKLVFGATALIICSANVSQANLIGDTVTSQYYAYGGVYVGNGSPATFVANGSVQQTFGVGFPEGFNLTVRGNQIEYDFLYNGYISNHECYG
jgi:hypothetical protein